MTIRRAIIRYGIGAVAMGIPGRTVVVDEPQSASRLLACFPHAVDGAESSWFGGWCPKYVIRFEPAEGEPIEVLVSLDCRYYNAHGDWPLKPGVGEFVSSLMAGEPTQG